MTADSMPYDADFYDVIRSGARRSADRIVPIVLDLTGARSVVDVGCGSGSWLASFRDHGVTRIRGVEGPHVDDSSLEVAPDVVVRHDLRQPLQLDERFDLAVSLEVAEHLPEASAPAFVASLTSLAPLVLFSAAPPHQGGIGHVNEQWPDWWADVFGGHGYVAVDCIRRHVWSDPSVEWWYAQNTLLYAHPDALAQHHRLRDEWTTMGTSQLSIVHPNRFVEWVEWGIAETVARWEGDASG